MKLLTVEQIKEQIQLQDSCIDKDGLYVKYNFNEQEILLHPSGPEGALEMLKKAKLINHYTMSEQEAIISCSGMIYLYNWDEYIQKTSKTYNQESFKLIAAVHEYEKLINSILNRAIKDQHELKQKIA